MMISPNDCWFLWPPPLLSGVGALVRARHRIGINLRHRGTFTNGFVAAMAAADL
jgi:hypothetical protein